ncbi:MAG: WYL domain-containing protein, partial [Lawsonibacter sp.]|nr:WYL domain-containing protein [Lawsonibacter sp.]
FKLRRIDRLTVTEEHFNLEAPEHILKRQQIDTSAYIKAIYRIKASMAFRVYDEISDYEIDKNGDFFCRLLMPDVGAICGYAASFGKHCTILAPREAVIEMKRRLEESLKNYF